MEITFILSFLYQFYLGFLTFINSYDVKSTTKMQNVFMFTKIAALIIIIIVGVAWMLMGMIFIRKSFFVLYGFDACFCAHTNLLHL